LIFLSLLVLLLVVSLSIVGLSIVILSTVGFCNHGVSSNVYILLPSDPSDFLLRFTVIYPLSSNCFLCLLNRCLLIPNMSVIKLTLGNEDLLAHEYLTMYVYIFFHSIVNYFYFYTFF